MNEGTSSLYLAHRRRSDGEKHRHRIISDAQFIFEGETEFKVARVS